LVAAQKGRVNLLKIAFLTSVILVICLFLWHTLVRLRVAMGIDGGVAAETPAVALGFLVLFLTGICYGLWVLLVEHYIAFALTREWIAGILKEIGGAEETKKRKYAV
jgi:TM2 domain-containing membrane protein YozV